MIIEDVDGVTPVVLNTMAGATNPRFKEIMEALVRHAHAFAREVNLTEAEFEIGVDFLNRIGQQTSDVHNEGILFSDSIGFSTLVCLLNNGGQGSTETAAALLGPFWRMNSPKTENGASILRSETPGPALFAHCLVRDPSGQPIAGVEVDVWHSSPVGLYENQDEAQADMNLRGKFITDSEGRFSFRSVRPAGYPVPVNGPVGDMLVATNNHPWRPAHLHFMIKAPGYESLITHVFRHDDQYLDSDAVFGVRQSLITDWIQQPNGEYTLEFNFVLNPVPK